MSIREKIIVMEAAEQGRSIEHRPTITGFPPGPWHLAPAGEGGTPPNLKWDWAHNEYRIACSQT